MISMTTHLYLSLEDNSGMACRTASGMGYACVPPPTPRGGATPGGVGGVRLAVPCGQGHTCVTLEQLKPERLRAGANHAAAPPRSLLH